MFDIDRITFDPKSGRPIAPIFWRITAFLVIYAWVMFITLAFVAYLALRNSQNHVAAACAGLGIFILLAAYLRRWQVAQARRDFAHMIAEYEKALKEPLF